MSWRSKLLLKLIFEPNDRSPSTFSIILIRIVCHFPVRYKLYHTIVLQWYEMNLFKDNFGCLIIAKKGVTIWVIVSTWVPQIQSCITQFFKNNKKWVLFCSMLKENQWIFFRNPSRTEVVTFSLGLKGCRYLGKFHYFECHYYEWLQYLK